MNGAPTPMAQLGRYELLTQLGEGGMARVFLAISRGPVGFNKLMVVKQIRPELAADEEFLEMFSDEARLALALHHPNIVETYEVFEEDGRHLIAMEYLDGQTLADLLGRLGRDRMPLEEHVWILVQVLLALHHAHDLSGADGLPLEIVHRDVSPSNVFLTYDGRVKLLDFGIAKAAGAISTTARGTVKAKIGYGAPEQFLSQKIDRRADIFSVGVMLWEALAGCRRKIGETRNAMIEARVSGLEPTIRAIRPQVPPAVASICDRATAVRPESRPDTAEELAYELMVWLGSRTRQVGPRDVGALMSRLFAAERQARRQAIERQLGGSDTDPTRSLPPRGDEPDLAALAAQSPEPPSERPTIVDVPPVGGRRPRSTPLEWALAPATPPAASPATPAAPGGSARRFTPPARRATPSLATAAQAPAPMPAHLAATMPRVTPAAMPRVTPAAMATTVPPGITASAVTPPPSADPGMDTWEVERPDPRRRRLLVAAAAFSAVAGAVVAVVAIGGSDPASKSETRVPSRQVDVARVGPSPSSSSPLPTPAVPPSTAKEDSKPGNQAAAVAHSAAGKSRPVRRARPTDSRSGMERPRSLAASSAASSGSSAMELPRPASRSIQPGEDLPRPSRARRPRRQLDEQDPYR